MVSQELSDELLAKYSNTEKPKCIIRPMARNAKEVRMLLEGTLPEGGIETNKTFGRIKYLDVKQTAQLLDVSVSLVRYYGKVGKIEREGGLYLVTSINDFKKQKESMVVGDKCFTLNCEQKNEIMSLLSDPMFSYSGKKSKSLIAVAEEFGVSRSSLNRAIQKEGMSSGKNLIEWSNEEIEALKSLALRYFPGNISKKMLELGYKRSSNSIYKKISLLKLKQDPMYAEEFSINQLADLFNVSRSRVYSAANLISKDEGTRASLSRCDVAEIASVLNIEFKCVA